MTTPDKACPFCGSTDVAHFEEYRVRWAMCRTCKAKGPLMVAERAGGPDWNTRAGEVERLRSELSGQEADNDRYRAIANAECNRAEALVEAARKGLTFAVLFIAFDGRDRRSPRLERTLDGLVTLALKADREIRSALAHHGAPVGEGAAFPLAMSTTPCDDPAPPGTPTDGAQLRPRSELLAIIERIVAGSSADDPTLDLEMLSALSEAAERIRAEAVPTPMLLFCPACGVQHIDVPAGDWTNPPHRSHLCGACGCIWRPADVPTEGVASITTRGSADTWAGPRGAAVAHPVDIDAEDARVLSPEALPSMCSICYRGPCQLGTCDFPLADPAEGT